MFGFSIFKIFFTIAVFVLVWQVFKWLKRRERMINAQDQESVTRASNKFDEIYEEMNPCPDCGAYIAKGSIHKCV